MTGIEPLRGIHSGRRIAVLGSSPTINLYRGGEDVSIAVNGAILCDAVPRADYFLCGDKESPNRSWWKPSFECTEHRVVATFIAPYDHVVVPDPEDRKRLVHTFENDPVHTELRGGNIELLPMDYKVSAGNAVFQYASREKQGISPNQPRLVKGGTIAGVASQLALVMGASEIHLYGCSFGTPPDGRHYAYDNQGEFGMISHTHPKRMDGILAKIADCGVRIYSHGWTELRVPTRLDIEPVKEAERVSG
jgi:hypothetical protein